MHSPVYVYCTPCRSRHCECKEFRSYEEETSFKSCFINQKTPKVLRNSVSSTSGIQLTMMKLSKGNDKRITPIPGPPYQSCVDVRMFLNLVLTSSPKKKVDTSEPGSFSSDFFRCTLMATTFRNQCSKQQTVGTWNVATNWIREFVQIWQNNSLGRMTNSSKKNGD